jgi:hypothetical protein
VAEIAAFADRISNCTMTDAIARGGEIPFISRLSPTMSICGRWYLQGQCKSNFRHAADHGVHQPPEIAAIVVWCQVAYA